VSHEFPSSVLDALAAWPGHAAVEHGDRVVTGGELLSMIGTIAGLADGSSSSRRTPPS
jgi:hypothetical protein